VETHWQNDGWQNDESQRHVLERQLVEISDFWRRIPESEAATCPKRPETAWDGSTVAGILS